MSGILLCVSHLQLIVIFATVVVTTLGQEKGEKGAPGLSGPQGPPGRPGAQGPPGIPGVIGSPGVKGERGFPGEPGQSGRPGAPGIDGAPGQSGAKGQRGTDGINGANGRPGRDGAKGVVGPVGDKGEIGARGRQGPQGLPGQQGVPGKIGLKGVKGEQGEVGLQGPIGPEGPIGNLGPPGGKGAKGAQGAVGFPGEKGDIGHQGIAGSRGEKGEAGPPGKILSALRCNPNICGPNGLCINAGVSVQCVSYSSASRELCVSGENTTRHCIRFSGIEEQAASSMDSTTVFDVNNFQEKSDKKSDVSPQYSLHKLPTAMIILLVVIGCISVAVSVVITLIIVSVCARPMYCSRTTSKHYKPRQEEAKNGISNGKAEKPTIVGAEMNGALFDAADTVYL